MLFASLEIISLSIIKCDSGAVVYKNLKTEHLSLVLNFGMVHRVMSSGFVCGLGNAIKYDVIDHMSVGERLLVRGKVKGEATLWVMKHTLWGTGHV